MKIFIYIVIGLLIYILIGFLISVLWAKYDAKEGEKADVDFYMTLVWCWIFLPFVVLCYLVMDIVLYIKEKLKVFYLKFFKSKKKS